MRRSTGAQDGRPGSVRLKHAQQEARGDMRSEPDGILATGDAEDSTTGPGSGSSLAVIESDGTITLPMEVVAQGLQVPVDALLPGMRSGIVYQTTEMGIGDDAGRFRITFRFRSRQCRILVEETGRILPAD